MAKNQNKLLMILGVLLNVGKHKNDYVSALHPDLIFSFVKKKKGSDKSVAEDEELS